MPVLVRQPERAGEPAAWILRFAATEADDEAREALEALLEEGGPPQARLKLDAGSAAPHADVELDPAENVLRITGNSAGLRVALDRTALKALTELWELCAQGAGEYHLEALDESQANPARTFLTLHLDGPPGS
ncbi:MAG: hypothetical protein L6R28_23010 [Planctomycetes bacterium]|nr:hypothetical protein [Planctomycetota bacterium]